MCIDNGRAPFRVKFALRDEVTIVSDPPLFLCPAPDSCKEAAFEDWIHSTRNRRFSNHPEKKNDYYPASLYLFRVFYYSSIYQQDCCVYHLYNSLFLYFSFTQFFFLNVGFEDGH